VATGSPGDGLEPVPADAPIAAHGARWTHEEDEELVAAVLAGTDLAVIAERHGRTRVGIEYRLLKMIPAGEDIPADQRLGWIMARLTDPGFDWRAQLAQPRPGRPDSTPLPPDAGEVLDTWQRINGTELSAERRARFVGSPAVRDLVHYPADVLRDRGRHVYQAHGRLLLDDWAAECSMPGVTDLPPPADLRKTLVKTGEAVRMLVAAAVAALPNEDDREVLERRLGLSGDRPQTLEHIGTESGVTRERIRQRLDRAATAITAGRARAGYRTVQAQARRRLSELIRGDDRMADESLILAVAELSFPHAHPRFVTRLIAGIAGVHAHHQSSKPDTNGSR
jgi:Sigma-70, region 4